MRFADPKKKLKLHFSPKKMQKQLLKEGKIPVCPFTLDERSNPEANIQPLSLDFLYESHQVISTAEIILPYAFTP